MLKSISLIVVYIGCLAGLNAQTINCSNGPPNGTFPGACCQKASSFDSKIFGNCFAQYGNSPPKNGKYLKGPMNGLECAFECILNSTNTLVNGMPNPQLLIQKTTATLASDPDWIPVVTAGINYCASQVSANSAKLQSSLKGDQINGKTVCSPVSAYMLGCMFTYEFRKCPSKKFTATNPNCKTLQSFFEQCPTPQINN